MSEDPKDYHNGIVDAKIDEMASDIAEIKKDLRTLITGFPAECENKRKDIHERINKIYWWIIGLAGGIVSGMALLLMRAFIK